MNSLSKEQKLIEKLLEIMDKVLQFKINVKRVIKKA